MSGRVNDSIAEKLEAAGLWRRAATRWLEVMRQRHVSHELEWLCRRRRYCFSKINPPEPGRPDFREIRLAADVVLEQMGGVRSRVSRTLGGCR